MASKRSREKRTEPCGNCGTLVTRPASDRSKVMFCSHSCYTNSAYHSENTSKRNEGIYPPRVEVTCAYCGAKFKVPPSKVKPRIFCSIKCRHADRSGVEQVTSEGYIRIFVGYGFPGATKTGHIQQHRLVMQELLGRPLYADENVHHKNGVRADNHLENLELWTTSQPKGQRVVDKVKWARELLDRYADLPPEV